MIKLEQVAQGLVQPLWVCFPVLDYTCGGKTNNWIKFPKFQLFSITPSSFTVRLWWKFSSVFSTASHYFIERIRSLRSLLFLQLSKLISLIFCLSCAPAASSSRYLPAGLTPMYLYLSYWRPQPGRRTPDVVLEVPVEQKNHFL